jgi:hypothetical protein
VDCLTEALETSNVTLKKMRGIGTRRVEELLQRNSKILQARKRKVGFLKRALACPLVGSAMVSLPLPLFFSTVFARCRFAAWDEAIQPRAVHAGLPVVRMLCLAP